MLEDWKRVEIRGYKTWVSRVSYWHIRQILEHKPKSAEFAYEKLVAWTKLKLDRYGNKKYKDRLKYLEKKKKEFIEMFRGEINVC